MRILSRLASVAVLAVAANAASAAVLWDNGSVVSNPTGGTGTIAGLPISQIEGLGGSTFGFGSAAAQSQMVADNFTVPAGPGWNLDTLTVYAYQTGATAPTVTTARITLYSGTPGAGGTVLAGPLSVSLTNPTLVAYRQTATTTNGSTRPIYSYDASLDGLPDAGVLAAGTYWIAFDLTGTLASGPWVPPVTPRATAPDTDARQFAGGVWSPMVDSGSLLPVAVPFKLSNSVIPEPASLGLLGAAVLPLVRRRRH